MGKFLRFCVLCFIFFQTFFCLFLSFFSIFPYYFQFAILFYPYFPLIFGNFSSHNRIFSLYFYVYYIFCCIFNPNELWLSAIKRTNALIHSAESAVIISLSIRFNHNFHHRVNHALLYRIIERKMYTFGKCVCIGVSIHIFGTSFRRELINRSVYSCECQWKWLIKILTILTS